MSFYDEPDNDNTGETEQYRIGTITGDKVKFDGEATASNKIYKKLNNITLSENDRVLLAQVSGTFIILGKIV